MKRIFALLMLMNGLKMMNQLMELLVIKIEN